MKKSIFIFIFICYAFIVTSAQDKLQLKSYLEGGYYNGNLSWKDDIGYHSTNNFFHKRVYSDLGFEVNWKNFKASTNLLTIIAPTAWHSYQPLQSMYLIGLDYKYRNIILKAEHMCTHSTEVFFIGGGYTKFGVRVYFINIK